MTLLFSTVEAQRTAEWIDRRIHKLIHQGYSPDHSDSSFDPELSLLERVKTFPFARFPDFAIPWHLIRRTEGMRWLHVWQVVSIIEMLKQPTGSSTGAAIRLEPFQILILIALLAPEDPATGRRIVKEGLLTIARKNAKTTLIAGLSTALMMLDPEAYGLYGQELQVGAADREQAGITHNMCQRFVSFEETVSVLDIEGIFRSVPSKKTLLNTKTMTQLRCLSSDAYRAHGGNPAVVLLDEIGNVPANQAEEFYSVLTTGFGAQREPLTVLMSTQAPNDQHFFSQQVDRAKRINEGAICDDSFAGFIFTVPETAPNGEKLDPFDEDLWYLANPGLGTICSLEDMRDWARKAKELPTLQNKFENLRLNRRISETAAFVSRVAWERCATTVDTASLVGKRCWLGLDLSETTDLTALVAVFEPGADGVLAVVPFYWVPGDGLRERSRRDRVPYNVWAREGLIDARSSQTIDYALIAQKIVDCIQTYNVQALGFDRWRMKFLRIELTKLGYEWDDKLDDPFLMEVGQGFKDQSRAIQLLEDAIVNTEIAHGNHPILKWNAANAVIVRDPAGNRKFEKAKSFGRIDGLVALAMALHAKDQKDLDVYGSDSVLNDSNRVFVI